ncbi:MAG: phosphoesterase, family [Evtepia sp.]|nr:phosphoesterase, family [Evtepia sp.]
MKRICIISDTHGLLRDEVKAELMASDIIIHAGDIDTNSVLQTLLQYGELHIVRGNNDCGWAAHLPECLAIAIEGVRFFIVHDKKDIPYDLMDTDVVIYGHSHMFAEKMVDGMLLLNPGSCGKRRFNLEITMCRMYVNEGSYHYEKIVIA